MNKMQSMIILFIVLAFALCGCELSIPTIQSTQFNQLTSPTVISPTSTLISSLLPPTNQLPLATLEQTPSPTLAPTLKMTPLNTLEPEDAHERIKILLREPVDCLAPCFWGIVPGQTTTEVAQDIFYFLGLQMTSNPFEGKVFSGIHYILDSGLSIRAILTIQNNVVEDIQIKITPELQKSGTLRGWSAYSPDTLIHRYGQPSHVELFADWGPGPFFGMQMYFDDFDLIVQYSGVDIIPSQKGSSQICPLTAQFDSVWLWMGENPQDPPGPGVSLEKATSLTVVEFSNLMIGPPDQACFIFNGDVYE